MRVGVLLSGGKDSVAAVELARGVAWDVVCALTIVPDEDDSFMFHHPNLAITPQVAKVLGLSLRSAKAAADPVVEIENLKEAITRLVEEFNLDGIISGALASEYQKTRIDRVCHEIGVKSFAPIWHKNPEIYLQSLLGAGYEIRFSRTAAEGVPNEWAGVELDFAMIQHMKSAPTKPHIAGEGGEYETLVLAAPHYVGKIHVIQSHTDASASRATWVIDESWVV